MNIMYNANENRYEIDRFRRCGNSGLLLPDISLGLWHNFGENDDQDNARDMLLRSFDNGITHFDLANNYGPPYGSAEKTFGKILKTDLFPYRDELIISTKAGWDMWKGPYGDLGSKKYIIASIDQSLRRMDLDYVDIFYHHRPDYETPLFETIEALAQILRKGKALYVGISQYDAKRTREAVETARDFGIKLLIHQPRYNIFDRWIESELLDEFKINGMGCIAFSPLAQGLLTNKYFKGIPEESRIARDGRFLQAEHVNDVKLSKAMRLDELAKERGESLAQFSINWVLRDKRITSALIGASNFKQIEELLKGRSSGGFSTAELEIIDNIMNED